MKIAMHNLYEMKGTEPAWFRKVGLYCFDFTWKKEFASDLTEEEALKIIKDAEWYCKQYRASHMTIEDRPNNNWRDSLYGVA